MQGNNNNAIKRHQIGFAKSHRLIKNIPTSPSRLKFPFDNTMNSFITVKTNSSNNASIIGSSERKYVSSCTSQIHDDITNKAPMHSDFVLINNFGVHCFENNRVSDATQCFRNAIEIFSSTTNTSTPRNRNTETTRRKFSCTCSDSFLESCVHDQDSTMNLYLAATSHSDECTYEGKSLNPTKVEQAALSSRRLEYDEGMNSHNSPLRIDVTKSDDYQITAPTLLYNIGLLHLRKRNETTAERYFLQALHILQHSSELKQDDAILRDSSSPLVHDAPIAYLLLHNLGRKYYQCQSFQLAIDMYLAALDIAEEPSSLATTLNCLGVVYFHLGGNNAEKALEMFNGSLAIRTKLVNASDPQHDSYTSINRELATTMNNKGRVHYMMGDHSAALMTYIEALKLRRNTLPPQHLDVGASLYNLGQTYHQLGKFTEAMELYNEFHSIISRSFFSEKHRDIATILKCMAQVHHEQSEYEDAARLYFEALETSKAVYGEAHPEISSLLNKIGNMYYENSDFDAAIKVYEEGLRVERRVYSNDHPNIVVTLTNIAQSQKHTKNYEGALDRYVEVYALQKKIFGSKDPKVAMTLSNVAQMYSRLCRFTQAFDVYQEVLQIRRDSFGDDHVEVASTLNSLGLVLFKQGFHGLAIGTFLESLRVRRLCLGGQHRDVAVVLYNIATTHLERGDEELASKYYEETLIVERTALGNNHRDMGVTLQHVGQIHRQRGELDKALGYFLEALEIARLNFGDSCQTARLLNKIGNIILPKETYQV